MTVVKRLNDGQKLSLSGQIDSSIDYLIKERTLFMSD